MTTVYFLLSLLLAIVISGVASLPLFQQLPPPLNSLMNLGFLLWWVLAVGFLIHDGQRRFRTRWLLGQHGLAHWQPHRVRIFPWEKLFGDCDLEMIRDEWGEPIAFSVTTHHGTRLHLNSSFTDSRYLLQRVVAQRTFRGE